ncbi:MAG TPA: methyltransferase domain-containing protein [Opitutaceae bacterium]|nr:methyltransferase domain-containing protein [Opitutaceae bacterium]
MAETAVDGRRDSGIIEIGAGTGRVTEQLWRLSNGRIRIRAVEADETLANRLQRRLPGVEVFSGMFEDAPERIFSGMERATVVSSVPLFALENDSRLAFFASLTAAIKRGGIGRYVQYTYWPVLPWAGAKTLCGTDPRLIALNFPPAWIWSQDH